MYDLESIRLKAAHNGFILEYSEYEDDEERGKGMYMDRKCQTLVFKFSEADKAITKMKELVATIVPSQKMKPEMAEMEED